MKGIEGRHDSICRSPIRLLRFITIQNYPINFAEKKPSYASSLMICQPNAKAIRSARPVQISADF
tara:strand:+ start:312 stop:506 length:195 start_codon:yes stop_codon:yes gene_type:complete